MSYILEALKKAQAERQLGGAPTIHTMPLQAAPQLHARGSNTPMWIAVALASVLALVVAYLWWRQQAPVAPTVPEVPPVELAQAAPVALPAPSVQAPMAPPAPSVQPPMVQPAPGVQAPLPVAAPALRPMAAARPAVPPPARAVPPAPVLRAPPAARPAAAPVEENLPYMRDLPEAAQGELPKVAFGGYMYSKNPSDRLLLIDKVLRHEGEEVAPGLILEQLQPKAAVMNYRGTRYRVAY